MSEVQSLLTASLSGYTIERELAGGGMSRVFLAVDTALARHVVVKVLPPDVGGGISVDRFRREIQVAARLQHPHVVPLLSAGEAGGLLYYTMPFVEGESLRTRLSGGVIPMGEAIRVIREVADALAYAHRQGVVHRDIKPENVLLSESHAMITDFGVAKALSAATADSNATSIGVAVGTPKYMAPEQAAAEPDIDHRADIYALGILAYELLSGAPPFESPSPQTLIAAHISRTPEPIRDRRPELPDSLAQLVMRCLEKQPADRPESADEVVRTLDSLFTASELDLDHSRHVGRTLRQRILSLRSLAMAAVLVVVGTVGGVLATRPSAPVLDSNLVAVAPFRVSGADPTLAYLREGMVDLLSAKLTGTITVVDPRSMLSAWKRAAGGETRDVDRAAAEEIARRFGAGLLLLGDIAGGGPALALNATLVDMRDRNVTHASTTGSQDSIALLVDRLAAELLVLGSSDDTHRMHTLARVPLPALHAYLRGQSLIRRGRYADAGEQYQAAIRSDSSFALAGMGLAKAQQMGYGGSDEGWRVAWRGRDQLSYKDRAILEAWVGKDYPNPPSGLEVYTLSEEAVRVAPDNALAWYVLGDRLYHHGPALGIEDAHVRAVMAFERSLALDSSSTFLMEHLPELYVLLGDTASLARALAHRWALDSSGVVGGISAAGYYAFLGNEREAIRWQVEMEQSPWWAVRVAIELGGVGLEYAERARRAFERAAVTEEQRTTAAWLDRRLAIQQGQPQRAIRAVARLSDRDRDWAGYTIEAVFADGDSAEGADARRRLEAHVTPQAIRERCVPAFAAVQYDLAHEDSRSAARLLSAVRNSPVTVVSPPNNASARQRCADLALLAEAQLAALERRPEALALLQQLDSTVRVRAGGSWFEHLGNLVAARLWEERGEQRRALAAIRRRTYSLGAPPWSTYLREEGRLAAKAGDRDGAIAAYRAYLRLRANAEPSFHAHLAGIRADLARLERERSDQ